MSLLSSFWDGFIEKLEKSKQNNPVTYPLLKYADQIKFTENKIIVSVDSLAAQEFLAKRTAEIEVSTVIERIPLITVPFFSLNNFVSSVWSDICQNRLSGNFTFRLMKIHLISKRHLPLHSAIWTKFWRWRIEFFQHFKIFVREFKGHVASAALFIYIHARIIR